MRGAMLAAVCALACVAMKTQSRSSACDAANVGVSEKSVIEEFAARAVGLARSHRWAELSKLVKYPVRINAGTGSGAGSSTTIDDAEAFIASAADIFRAIDQSDLAEATPPKLLCRTGAVGFAGGVLWATAFPGGLAITSINCPRYQLPIRISADVFRGKCGSEVVVVERISGQLWLRIAKGSAAPPGAASETREKVEEDTEGTGACEHRVWRASSAGSRYEIAELGCSDREVPSGAIGLLSVRTGDGEAVSVVCIRVPAR
jgi:hypothetical protein